MKVNLAKYIAAGEDAGLAPVQVTFASSTEATVEVFNEQVETQSIGTNQDIAMKGLHDGKVGSFATDCMDGKTPALMAEQTLLSAKFGKEEKAENFFDGKNAHYQKTECALKDFKPATLKELREVALKISADTKARDSRITSVQVQISMMTSFQQKANSLGMKCSDQATAFVGYIEVIAENEAKEPRSGGEQFSSFHSLDDLLIKSEKASKEAVSAAVDFFGTGPIASGKYQAILAPDVVASLLDSMMGHLSAKNVEKHLSVFEGKLEKKILSSLLTIRHTPHLTDLHASSYDSDGVPSQEFTLIEKGTLKTYFHSLETAHSENLEPNGCGTGNGTAGPILLSIDGGKDSLEGLFAKMKDGIYLTSVSGLNSGINEQTLEFSLPCSGYIIKGGKISGATSMIICAGNLKKVFNHVVALGKDSESRHGFVTPAFLVKDFAISGK